MSTSSKKTPLRIAPGTEGEIAVKAPAKILAALKRRSLELAEVAQMGGVSKKAARAWLRQQRDGGLMILRDGDQYALATARPSTVDLGGKIPTYHSRPDGTYLFGAMGDSHLCSKYERLDALNDLYDRYQDQGVDRVYHTGNWIDGEARFNQFDIHTRGITAQCEYLAKNYPKRDGLETFAVAGDDHEGWYAQKMGVDIGHFALTAFQDEGRTDWHDLGYMSAYVRLVDSRSGKSSIMDVQHPGGGSAYALSYTVQKIVESYSGGDKPAVGLYGHYHKLEYANYRNVWCIQTGCQCDQTPFMKKKRLSAHVGGTVVKLKQDPRTGAIFSCTVEMLQYFNRGYYNKRWSMSHNVTKPRLSLGVA